MAGRSRKHLTPKASTRVQRARETDIQHMTVSQLRSYIANEGKRLNQQLVQLEKTGMTTQSFAYERLTSRPEYTKYLGMSKSGHVKINLSTRGLKRGAMQRIAGIIEKFANAKTITQSGIESYYSGVFNSLRNSYAGMSKLTDDQLADILKTEGFAHAKATVGSDTIMKMIANSVSPQRMKEMLEDAGSLTTSDAMIESYNNIMSRKITTAESPFVPVPDYVFVPFAKSTP